MKRLENVSVPSSDDREISAAKLTQINGIATKTAKAMYEIGIRTYADLIKYLERHTAQEFSIAIKEHGVNRGSGLIDREMWLREAKALSEVEKTAPTLLGEKAHAQEKSEPAEPGHGAKEHDAMFTVSFDIAINDAGERVLSTTVYHEGNGGAELVFHGTDAALWVNWILERANLPFSMKPMTPEIATTQAPPSTEVQASRSSIPGEINDFVIEIDDVQFSAMSPAGSAKSEQRLKANLDISLTGSDAEQPTLQGLPFRMELYTISLDDGFPRHVGSCEDRFRPHVLRYSYQLEIAMPAVGRYELHSAVRLLPSGELRAYHQGPVLRVTP